ncbi:MAG: sulfatase-like hydrolase/transferase [Pirellulales bacterium]
MSIPLKYPCLLMIVLVGAISRSAAAADSPDERPNILFIMVDDLGKEWIGCYGAQGIETPHIDALAAGGMQFENAYSMPQCTPSRVTLLTGQYPFRHGWTNHFDVPRWGSGAHFDPEQNASFARVVRDAGYATAAAGKWQIDDFRVEPNAMHEVGFDEWCMWTGFEEGNRPSAERYWDPYIHMRDRESKTHRGKFGPDLYCDFLIDFMRRHRDQPMLLYFPLALTHTPFVNTPDEPDAQSNLDRHKAMVRYTDKLVGRLVAALDETGLRNRTLIIFTTDNGTVPGIHGRRLGRSVNGGKTKHSEAGTAMPFIVNAPGMVPKGVVTDALTDFTDILPTFAELAGGTLDEQYVVDGHSIAPLLLGKATDTPRKWILAMGGSPAAFRDNRITPASNYDDRVIRDKRWKLWIDSQAQPEKLFDLRNDPWETTNLISSDDQEAKAARDRLLAVIEAMPDKDAAPRYRRNPAQEWDKFDYVDASQKEKD